MITNHRSYFRQLSHSENAFINVSTFCCCCSFIRQVICVAVFDILYCSFFAFLSQVVRNISFRPLCPSGIQKHRKARARVLAFNEHMHFIAIWTKIIILSVSRLLLTDYSRKASVVMELLSWEQCDWTISKLSAVLRKRFTHRILSCLERSSTYFTKRWLMLSTLQNNTRTPELLEREFHGYNITRTVGTWVSWMIISPELLERQFHEYNITRTVRTSVSWI